MKTAVLFVIALLLCACAVFNGPVGEITLDRKVTVEAGLK